VERDSVEKKPRRAKVWNDPSLRRVIFSTPMTTRLLIMRHIKTNVREDLREGSVIIEKREKYTVDELYDRYGNDIFIADITEKVCLC
jgi:hypothetical protein